jgi:hypothetical protein
VTADGRACAELSPGTTYMVRGVVRARACVCVCVIARVGDSVHIQLSRYPVPCLAPADNTVEWMRSLADCLHWNARVQQRGVPVPDARCVRVLTYVVRSHALVDVAYVVDINALM